MKPIVAKSYQLIKDTVKEFSEDNCPRLGAALAFYTALSLAPMLLVVLGIAGLVFGEQAAQGQISGQLNDLVGADNAKTIEDMMAASRSKSGSIWSTILGVGSLIVGATGVFIQLQDAINTVWGVKVETTGLGILTELKNRLLSFTMICTMAFLLLVSLVFSAFLTGLAGGINRLIPYGTVWMGLLNMVVSFLLTTAMFAMIFKLLPKTKLDWGDVWIGAAVTALLFNLGKYLISLYMGMAAVGSPFGAAGSFVVLLMWIYFSTQILLFGAEFTQIFAKMHGSKSTQAFRPPVGTSVPLAV
ncbi:YihY/virulence factor BrkB family protein [Zavarzinella formosa]|uniref:YihY/virulence factor BrkB family protein n=1 Tax=Zavarzinella formosa TaxID=360055 RepID=UPI0002F4713A|nr:YihY/virulence factor BrkB family protein [Zavarzinella formosa]